MKDFLKSLMHYGASVSAVGLYSLTPPTQIGLTRSYAVYRMNAYVVSPVALRTMQKDKFIDSS